MPRYNDEFIEAEADMFEEIMTVCKQRRTELGISQEDLAQLITGRPNSQDYISRLENGVIQGLNVRTMSRLLKALRIKMILKPEKI